MSRITDRVSSFVSPSNLERVASYNYGPISMLAAFAGSHLLLQARLPQLLRYGIDDNVHPRDNLLGESAERYLASGKVTPSQLNRLRRWEAAHYNAVENLPVFIGAVLSLQLAGAPNRIVNRVCAVWLAARAAYAGLYITIESPGLSWLRTASWWISNSSVLYAFYEAANRINHNVGTGTVAL
ncbi:hypothetical protein ACQY0O_003504 [Thecaphora frezii]|nr:hypothetical protein [Thecaphora frezii]